MVYRAAGTAEQQHVHSERVDFLREHFVGVHISGALYMASD